MKKYVVPQIGMTEIGFNGTLCSSVQPSVNPILNGRPIPSEE